MRTYASYLAYRRGDPAEATGLAGMVIGDDRAAAEDHGLALRDGLQQLELAQDHKRPAAHFQTYASAK